MINFAIRKLVLLMCFQSLYSIVNILATEDFPLKIDPPKPKSYSIPTTNLNATKKIKRLKYDLDRDMLYYGISLKSGDYQKDFNPKYNPFDVIKKIIIVKLHIVALI